MTPFFHEQPITCSDCHKLFDGGDEGASGHETSTSTVFVGNESGWVYFGDPTANPHEDKHVCPTCAVKRWPALMVSVGPSSTVAASYFHPPSISTKDATTFALAVSRATVRERNDMGSDFGIERFGDCPGDSSKLILYFGDKRERIGVEAIITDVTSGNPERAIGLLRSAIGLKLQERQRQEKL